MLISVTKLERGYPIKFRRTQRKWRTFKKMITLDESQTLPEGCRGKVLVIYDNCKQAILDPKDFVVVDDEYIKRLEKENNLDPICSADDLPF